MSGPKVKVLLLAALSTGSTALDCLAESGGFETMLVTHGNTDASDFAPLIDKAKELHVQTVLYGGRPVTIKPDGARILHHVDLPVAPDDDYLNSFASEFKPDVGLCIGWSKLLSARTLAIPRLGVIGHHESMLPKRRGRAPIVWPILHDCVESGLSFFWLTEGVDDGDIFCQAPFPIGPRDTSADLLTKANQVTRDLLLNDVLPNLKAGNFKRTPQDHSQATYCPRRTPDMGYIPWHESAESIDRTVRALTKPYPGAFSWHRLRKIFIWQARPVTPQEHHPDLVYQRAGTVVWVSENGARQWVACGGGLLEIYLPVGRMKVGDRFDGQQYFEP